jgi:BirA family transcriptional regulator, biotin operon repressor / biotin---[acetyl-CoA-carboxylase] ligase
MLNWQIKHIKSCHSTNDLLKEERNKQDIGDKTAIMTDFQSAGRGQEKNRWHSEDGKNLLCSLYVQLNLKADRHFMITIAVSLAVNDLLNEFSINSTIKWPNDIYAGHNKIAGMLIENSLMGDRIRNTIIGIGLNVNQNKFPKWVPNPVSMNQLTGNVFDLSQILETLLEKIDVYLNQLQVDSMDKLYHQYIELLYGYNTWRLFDSGGHAFNGQIRGVMPDGRLLVETESGQLRHFLFGEIKWLGL